MTRWPSPSCPITAALSGVAIGVVPGLFAAWFGPAHGTLAAFAGVLATALAVVLALALGFGLAQPLSGFALEPIVHHVEAREGAAAWPQASFLVNLQRSLGSAAVSWAFGTPLLALLFVVGFLFPPAASEPRSSSGGEPETKRISKIKRDPFVPSHSTAPKFSPRGALFIVQSSEMDRRIPALPRQGIQAKHDKIAQHALGRTGGAGFL